MKKKAILFTLLFLSSYLHASDNTKIFYFDGRIEVGVNLTCPFDGMSQIANPNTILSRNANHFELLVSLRSLNPSIACSPLPHEFIDQYRDYFVLGNLANGNYSISVRYVNDDENIPPATGVTVNLFSQLSFTVNQPATIPVLNLSGILLMLLLVIMIVFNNTSSKLINKHNP